MVKNAYSSTTLLPIKCSWMNRSITSEFAWRYQTPSGETTIMSPEQQTRKQLALVLKTQMA
ncbi:hypothetical protein LC605_08235 [Nostoc sp. CHAB 5836]|uniref:hypothetical protein n=1 Tax=Nostoc sp. CHAB 5836 TaxID=2780404 RepID=UPI001E518C53|nr:hypothetical protein [Nostoc sp. CHAB 5836]MCC5615066.1 hypothetical protein [Nostoc sp. CHAB 5836]